MDSIGAIRGSNTITLPPAVSAPVNSAPLPPPRRDQDAVSISPEAKAALAKDAKEVPPTPAASSPLKELGA